MTKRFDGAPKGTGWRGPIPTKGGIMTELSVGVDNKQIPLITPFTSDNDIEALRGVAAGGKPSKSLVQKAVYWAKLRSAMGLDPFYNGADADKPFVRPYIEKTDKN